MPRTLPLASMLLGTIAALGAAARAQSLDDLKIQVHGYATQSFLKSANNSWNTTDSENGSAGWNEAVLNVSSQPDPKLRIGIQARFFLLGDYGNKITLDWAQADYKVNEFLGFRVGKVKTPVGLLNESQDIDPAQLWVLLPQSIYPLPSRNTILAHYGGVVYGQASLGEKLGKLQYRAFGGQRVVAADDGYFQSTRDEGVTVPNGVTGATFGGTLRWETPLPGLSFGASENAGTSSGELQSAGDPGDLSVPQLRTTYYFGQYEHGRAMLAGEYSRLQLQSILSFAGAPDHPVGADHHEFYIMSSCRLTGKLNAGLYYSSSIDHKLAQGSARYQKDWALATRYDFNPYLYAKFEQHFIDGTELNYSIADNPNLQPNDRMTLLKFGVSF